MKAEAKLSTGVEWPALATAVKRHTVMLVVDPDRAATALVAKALRRSGDRVFTAHSVAEAWSVLALAGSSIERAIVSTTQADGEGAQLARAIREQYPAIQILVTTDRAIPEKAEFRHLEKPFTVDQLWAALA
jgi:DNA-binding NtrC family response regulator